MVLAARHRAAPPQLVVAWLAEERADWGGDGFGLVEMCNVLGASARRFAPLQRHSSRVQASRSFPLGKRFLAVRLSRRVRRIPQEPTEIFRRVLG